MPDAYCYPDPSETTTLALIAESGHRLEEWERSEELAVAIALGLIAERFGGQARSVDAGAGTGRLTRPVGAVSAAVTATELDPSRFDVAQMRLDAEQRGYELRLEPVDATRTDELLGAPFDAMMLSHVIQHTPRDVTTEILASAARALYSGGVLNISVPLSSHKSDDHVIAGVVTGRYIEDPVAASEFDRRCTSSAGGNLPTRKFGLRGLLAAVESHGFRVEHVLAFHFQGDHSKWPSVPCVADIAHGESDGVIDAAIVATRL
jgi:SAM-dependent methyltransferase